MIHDRLAIEDGDFPVHHVKRREGTYSTIVVRDYHGLPSGKRLHRNELERSTMFRTTQYR